MADEILDGTRICIRVSTSISNFYTKLLLKFHGFEHYNPRRKDQRNSNLIFFGLYHTGDYLRFMLHQGSKIVFWCGGDILNLRKSIFRFIIPRIKANHLCENEVERRELMNLKISAAIKPMFFGNPNEFPISFRPSDNPQVFLCAHRGREEEYGLETIEEIAWKLPEIVFHIYGVLGGSKYKNVVYHGKVPESLFNSEIKQMQACLRLNTFDGFADCMAKSILLGQYPITAIRYPNIDYAESNEDLLELLKGLKYKKEANYFARQYWYNILK